MATFPDPEWVTTLMDKLNADSQYGRIAKNWEGDMIFVIEPGGSITESMFFYLDTWHGKCRDAYAFTSGDAVKSVFTFKAPYPNFVRLLKGDLDPMQAMLTRKLSVQGNMAVILRNVPTVFDFVRCAREITSDFK
jgi:putative sterol carrier protein